MINGISGRQINDPRPKCITGYQIEADKINLIQLNDRKGLDKRTDIYSINISSRKY